MWQIDRIEGAGRRRTNGCARDPSVNCAPGDPSTAGRLVFDLDPAPDVKFAAVIEAALELRDAWKPWGSHHFARPPAAKACISSCLSAYSGATASNGRLPRTSPMSVCAQMASDSPKKYLDTMSKSQRVGRSSWIICATIKTATAVAPLSPRARAGAPVSMR